jgi:hypothetical protein
MLSAEAGAESSEAFMALELEQELQVMPAPQ